MQDHHLLDDDGHYTAVADLPASAIMRLLREGADVVYGVTEDEFMERLRIELVVREID